MSGLTYRPGTWTALVGEELVLLAEAPEAPSLTRLWKAVLAGGPPTTVLQALVGEGWTTAPPFVLVHQPAGDDRAGVFVRGGARVHVVLDGRAQVLRADHVTTWAEHRVERVQRIELPGTVVGDPALPLVAGVVLAGMLEWTGEDAPVEPRVGAGADDVPVPTIGDALGVPPPRGYAHPSASTSTGTDSPADRADHGAYADGGYGDVTLAPEAGRQLPSDRATPVPRGSRAALVLRFSTGEVVPVTGPVLIGREPSADRASPGDLPRIVTVPSPHADVSRNHLAVRPSADGHTEVVVEDLHSTNGTIVRPPDAPETVLSKGASTSVMAGTVLDLGDAVTVTVGQAEP